MIENITLIISAFGTAIISAIVGMAGGVTLLSILTFFMPLFTIVPIHGAVQLVSNTGRCFLLKDHIIWDIFKWYLLGLPLGTTITTYFIKNFQFEQFALLLVLLLIWYTIFRPKWMPEIRLPLWGYGILSLFVGILNPIVGATGPLQASFFIRDDWDKKEIVATKAVVQAYGHLLKLPVFFYLGFDYLKYTPLVIAMSIAVLIGTKVGVGLLHKTSDHVFRFIYRAILFLASLKILYTVITYSN